MYTQSSQECQQRSKDLPVCYICSGAYKKRVIFGHFEYFIVTVCQKILAKSYICNNLLMIVIVGESRVVCHMLLTAIFWY